MAARRLPRGSLRAAAATALAVGLLAGAGAVAPVARAQTITVLAGGQDRPRPAAFVSLSLQYRTIQRWTAPAGRPADPVLVALVRNLDPTGVPVIRVGGQGGDRTWWPAPGLRRPLGVSDSLSTAWTSAARRLADALNARYQLQVNLEADDPRLARVEADHLLAGVGRSRIAAWEIGNEPDLYTSQPWYWEDGGHPLPWYADRGTPVYARATDYGASQFVAEFQRFAAGLPGPVPLAGPDLVSPSWLSDFTPLMTARSRLRILDAHAYPLLRCVTDPSSPHYPSIPHLLALPAARDLLAGYGPAIAQAHADGGRFVVDEIGADSCGGNPGVSDTMATALWVIDTLFALDRAGVDAVDLHNLPGAAGVFNLSRHGAGWRARLEPIYLGALLFAQAAPAGSRLLAVDGADQSRVRTWATTAQGVVRVALVDPGRAITVTLRPPAGATGSSVEIERLRAASAAATGGVRYAGSELQSTTTGVLPTPHPTVVRLRGGVVRVSLPPASAALVTFPRRAPSNAHRRSAGRR